MMSGIGPRVAFVVPSLRLSGGINVVVQHAVQLANHHGFDVTLVISHEPDSPRWQYPGIAAISVIELNEATTQEFDLTIATWWDTVQVLWDIPSKRQAYFVQSLEDRFHAANELEGELARLTYLLGLPVITEARWIRDTLAIVDPDQPAYYVRNGIDKAVFSPPDQPPALDEGPLRIFIEATPAWFKGLNDALDIVDNMTEPSHVSVSSSVQLSDDVRRRVDVVNDPMTHAELFEEFGRHHLILKTSRVEGMYGPPLEAFHAGATVVTTPVTGHDEYVQHGWNGMVIDWDDPKGSARMLDLLSIDRGLLNLLRTNALATAQLWPSWDQASATFAAVLAALLDAEPTNAFTAAQPLYIETRSTIERFGYERHRLWEKQQADREHIAKLDDLTLHLESDRAIAATALRAAQALAAQLEIETEALRRSRLLRLLHVVERPWRRLRPGSTVLERIRNIGAPNDPGL